VKNMKRPAATVLTALLATVIAMAAPASADVTDVSGSGAFGVRVTATVVGGPTVDVGPIPSVNLPADGGDVSDDLASVDADDVLQLGLLEVSSQGANLGTHQGFASSQASVAEVTAIDFPTLDDPVLEASLITAQCTSNGDGSIGQASLVTAALAGESIDVSPPPNTTIPLPGIGQVVLNEQIVTNTPGVETSITVNAVHITVNVAGLVTADIIISQARCRAAGPDVLLGPPSDGGPGGPDGPGAGPDGPGAGGPGAARPAAPVVARPVLTG
jgi:hypothetical protein